MCRVRRQVARVVGSAGEDDAARRRIRRDRDDGVHGGDFAWATGRGSQLCRTPRLRLTYGANPAGLPCPVDMEVAAMVPGQGFGEYHAGNIGRPQTTADVPAS